jgi:hypothetical protein
VWCISPVLGRPIKNRGIRLIATVPSEQSRQVFIHTFATARYSTTARDRSLPMSYCSTVNLLLPSLDTWTNSGDLCHNKINAFVNG